MIGKTLAHYEITELLGKGGMGEVYRARDAKLARDVALKVLPADLAGDAERAARFQREARTLASLQHANIASIYGYEDVEGTRFLTMELVEGEDLSERLKRGSLDIDEAIRVAREIAIGLEAAHERGVVHRDLKPANIKVDRDGAVKILDFGLARAFLGDGADPQNLETSPTITAAMTHAGIILGTAAYMSPEQAKGKPVDRRSDIWSYGVILYELLCGKTLFGGETVSETMAEVMMAKIEWSALPKDTPRGLIALLERCLDRDPLTRLQSIGEARVLLQRGFEDEGTVAVPPVAVTARESKPWPWIVAVGALLALVAVLLARGLGTEEPVDRPMKFQLTTPHAANLRQGGGRHITISPDGTRIAALGAGATDLMIFVRDLGSFDWKPVQGTESGLLPTFSPDGKWLAFWQGEVFKVSLAGGAPIRLGARTSALIYVTHWAPDGYLYFAATDRVSRISESGGEFEDLYVLESDTGGSLGGAFVLPDGRGILLHTTNEGRELDKLHVLDLQTSTLKDLGLIGVQPKYVEPGVIVFGQGEQVLAARFDLDRLEVVGSPVPVLDRVWIEDEVVHFDIAANGTVAYLPDLGDVKPSLHVVDRDGVAQDLFTGSLPFNTCSDPRISPDGKRLIVSANRWEVWMIDLATETPTLLSENGFYPVWTADGSSLIYGSTRTRSYNLYKVSANLSDPEILLLDWENSLRTAETAPDGTLVFREQIPDKGMDLMIWPDLSDPETIRGLLDGPDDELAPAVSPNGAWMAFVSDLSGQDEIYVTSFPQPRGRIQISSGGGVGPAWSKNGDEIFYTHRDELISVRLVTEPDVRVVSRDALFRGSYLTYRWYRQYDVMPDGEHFLMISNPPRGTIEVVTNWFYELERALADDE